VGGGIKVHSTLRPLNGLWWNRWNEWQGKPKYSEKTCPSAALSTTNPTCCPARTRSWAAMVGSQRLTAELRHGLGTHLPHYMSIGATRIFSKGKQQQDLFTHSSSSCLWIFLQTVFVFINSNILFKVILILGIYIGIQAWKWGWMQVDIMHFEEALCNALRHHNYHSQNDTCSNEFSSLQCNYVFLVCVG
jgi:hypothetical protein